MSSPTEEEEEEEEEVAGGEGEEGIGGGGLLVGDPSSSRAKSAEAVWPDHFVEALVARVAVDAASVGGRLAAAPAVANVFQVCSTWRSVSQSELLWEEMTHRIWPGLHRQPVPPATWHHEFARLHLTGRNFETGRCVYSSERSVGRCICLVLSDTHVAAGFMDGTVRTFRLLPSLAHVATYAPQPQHARLGLYSVAVSGLALLPNSNPDHVVFASLAGDIHVAPLLAFPGHLEARRSRAGNPVESGTMVSFAAGNRRWVGLFAGVPGRSWSVWDAATEELLYVGGTLTDDNAVMGWRQLAELLAASVGRVRMSERGAVAGCTISRVEVMDLENNNLGDIVAGASELRRVVNVDMMDACDGKVMLVDGRGMARICIANNLEEVCRFSTGVRVGRRGQQQQQQQQGCGCMNWGYAFVCVGGEVRVWNATRGGQFLYGMVEGCFLRAVAANGRYVAAWGEDSCLHAWDFGDV